MYAKSKRGTQLSNYPERIMHYVNMAMMGINLNYDDFSMQELRDMEYTYLIIKQKEKANFFDVLFDGFGKMFKGILKSFK